MNHDLKQRLYQLFEKYNDFLMENEPEWATCDKDHRFDDKLRDFSAEAFQERYNQCRKFNHELEKISIQELDEAEKIHYLLMQYSLKQELLEEPFNPFQLAIHQKDGIHLTLPVFVAGFQPLNTPQECENYFKRLKGFEKQVVDISNNMKMGLHNQVIWPQYIMKQTLTQIEDILKPDTQNSPFYTALLNRGTKLSESEKNKALSQLSEVLEQSVFPAYEQLLDFIQHDYLPHCPDESKGLWSMPSGQEWYQVAIQRFTSLDLSPESVHELGLSEVDRIQEELNKSIKTTGFSGSLQEYYHYLKSDPKFYYTQKEDLIQAYEEILQEIETHLPNYFGILPKASYVMREIESYRAASAPGAHYFPPAKDHSRPGYFYINTHDLPSRPKFEQVSLALHEAIPGHHLQMSLHQEIKDMPAFRDYLNMNGLLTGYMEGWALYTESLGHDMGLYENTHHYIGALLSEMFRACRLVVETGLHAYQWTPKQAANYLRKYTSLSDFDIESEIARYLVLPGQALSYKIGDLKIQAIKKRAIETLGEQFNLKKFHDVILKNGSITLSMLEQQVIDWIQSESNQ